MICPRCGAVRRRETARFCHECGATFEPSPANIQPGIPESSTPAPAPQHVRPPRPAASSPRGPEEHPIPEKQMPFAGPPPQQPSAGYPGWQNEAPAGQREQQPISPYENKSQAPESPHMAHGYPSGGARLAPPVWPEEPPAWGEQQPQPAFPSIGEASALRERPASPGQHMPRDLNQGTVEGHAEPLVAWQAAAPERPLRSSTRGPVPGALHRSRPITKRRLPLGVIVTLGLLLVFVVAGVGIYAIVTGSGNQEPSSFLTYTDPGHHFTIQYPTVWTVKQLPNGVRFADATNTAELSVTYTPNSSNLTAVQFANQQAAKEGISTPDTQTFAGTTWVQRSGIVTQTSGISQDIFLFVTVANNLLYEVREVAPLDGYKEPNQTVFIPMLKSLTLS